MVIIIYKKKRQTRVRPRCEHGRRKAQCKACKGIAICEHGRLKAQCNACGGSKICEHGRQKYECKDCGGSGVCEQVDEKLNARHVKALPFVRMIE